MAVTIFIDESGTLPDPKDKVVIVAAVGVKDVSALNLIFKSVKKRRLKKEKLFELKFYRAGDKTKKVFFDQLSKKELDIFILIIDKMGRAVTDSPENFAILCGLLISEITHLMKFQKIIFDRHFQRRIDEKEFNKVLLQFLDKNLFLEHVDSKENILVNTADMIAGAVLAKETKKDAGFYEVIKSKVISEIRLNWPEVKRRIKKLA
ncbi:MAG: DUF3800 domain-containing protein [Candidatus Levybacteria bacterium]|nr:DUF3800 domain-containing protein [Candidatus Levybacteria bacterium]